MTRKSWIGILAVGALACFALGTDTAQASKAKEFTSAFDLEGCTFSTTGQNQFFSLEPGHRLVLRGLEGKEQELVEVQITVTNDTESINMPGIGNITTRVIEERETADGVLVEVSRNFFARCEQTNSVFYFGEAVDIFEEDGSITHEGAWRAGVGGAQPGIIMPGEFLLGSRYYQEVAPGVAQDRAEHVRSGLTVNVPAGTFHNAVLVQETTPLERSISTKIYAPGVGLIVDGTIQLVEVVDP
ncbi:MAG TPA: hypothetical protein VFG76_03105 [Candidatus Polarisedimenticolia bacterium]|nr:hypothetical protein [Candidatus Polarisedimenticolia bacterium]